MTEEKYSQRFRTLVGEFYRLLVEYERLKDEEDCTATFYSVDSVGSDLRELMNEIDGEMLNRLTPDEEIDGTVEKLVQRIPG